METERTKRSHRERPAPRRTRRQPEQIQYTQPKPFFRNRLMVQILSIAAVVLAVTVGISIFFKVDTILVTGAAKHSAHTIAQASGIESGNSLLFFGRARAAGKIKMALPYVDTVRFELKLPGTVNIIVEEKMVAYALQATDGSWWMMTSDGMIAEQVDASDVESCPMVEGILLQDPQVGEQAVAAEIPVDGAVIATAADRLAAAITVLSCMEQSELLAPANRLDVSDLFALRLYCGDNYRVELGDTTDMDEKILMVKYTLQQLDGTGGVLKLKYNETERAWFIESQPWSQS